MPRLFPSALLSLSLVLPAAAQTATAPAPTAAARRAAATITEAAVRRHINIIAHDSMGGRWTPSRGLDLTAAYLAGEFRRLGLQPGGDDGGYIQLHPIRQEAWAPARSLLEFSGPGGAVSVDLAGDAVLLAGRGMAEGAVVVAAGLPGLTEPPPDAWRGKAIVWVGDWSRGGVNLFQVQRALARLGAAMVILPVNSDSAFAALGRNQLQTQTVGGYPAPAPPRIVVREAALFGRLPALREAAAAVRSATTFTAREVSGLTARADVVREARSSQTAPNVVAILPGSDPVLRDEYVVYSAHMDHVGVVGAGGCQARGGDSICNGADDNASGTVGILEVAKAFAAAGVAPARSIIFVAVSGEERGLWGSDWFAGNPPVPGDRLVANLNADMIGRNWRDTIVVIGKEHSDLGQTLHRVVARHPELGLAAIDDPWPEQSFYTRSDHYHFARRGVPILFFFSGTHEDYHRPSDTPDKIDAEKLARVARLMFWVGLEVANTPERPRWDPESYRRYVNRELRDDG
jgi:hypothetical protein